MMNRIVLALVLAVPVCPIVSADKLYVDAVNGNDAWDGRCSAWNGDQCGPKKTIRSGVDAASDGDSVILADGVYGNNEDYPIRIEGKQVLITSANGRENCVVAWACCEYSFGLLHVEGSSAAGTELRDLSFRGEGGTGSAVSAADTTMLVEACAFEGFSHTCKFDHVDVAIHGCHFGEFTEILAIESVGGFVDVDTCEFLSRNSIFLDDGAISDSEFYEASVHLEKKGLISDTRFTRGSFGGSGVGRGVVLERCEFDEVIGSIRGRSIEECSFVRCNGGGFAVVEADSLATSRFVSNEGLIFANNISDCIFVGSAVHPTAIGAYEMSQCRIHNGVVFCVYEANRIRVDRSVFTSSRITVRGTHEDGGELRISSSTLAMSTLELHPGDCIGGGTYVSLVDTILSPGDIESGGRDDCVSLILDHCCLEHEPKHYSGEGSLFGDPSYVDLDGPDEIAGTEDDDVHLMADSICRNAGRYTDCASVDWDGEPRVMEGRQDIGVDEYFAPGVAPGDLNCDECVDFNDIDPFVVALVSREEYEHNYPECRYLNGDVNRDEQIDFNDIDPFVECLLRGLCE